MALTVTIRIDFLTRPSLSDPTFQYQRLEWPPHPRRLFEALTAAHYEAEVGNRKTLLWLERQPPPEIASPEIHPRDLGITFVPVNDAIKSLGNVARDTPLADCRSRQPRHFPTGFVQDRSLYYTWHTDEAPPEDLDDILREVTRLGHSTSLVTASLSTREPPVPSWIPDVPSESDEDRNEIWRLDGRASRQLRVPREGTLDLLDEVYAWRSLSIRKRDQRRMSLPLPTWWTYRRVAGRKAPRGPWRLHWTWSLEPRPSLPVWLHVADAVRSTVLSALPKGAPGVLTGHGSGHFLAVVPLSHVGHRHASGDVLGFAVLAPQLDRATRRTLLAALAAVRELRTGPLGTFQAEQADADEYRQTLAMETWVGPSRNWATVTPMVFDRFPKGNLPPEAVVAQSIERLGLPPAAQIEVTRDGHHIGNPPSSAFTVQRRSRGGDHRPWSHVFLRWAEPVAGPIVLGARRHFGLGFCRPCSEARPEENRP